VSSTIAGDRHVFVSMIHQGSRWWMTDIQSDRRPRSGELYLRGSWSQDASVAKSFTYTTSTVIRRRLSDESNLATQISFTAGNAASEFLD